MSQQKKKRKLNDEAPRGMSCPFHTIAVTSPDSMAAQAALQGPLKKENLDKILKVETGDINIISTSDPFDTRMGSGGGTLAALQEADSQKIDKDGAKGSTLIIHAGGQSSRSPTLMTLGKAWTDLPLLDHEQVANPTYMLMESLSDLLRNLPHDSVVVAASDVILDLPRDCPIAFDNVNDDAVLGLGVPAPLNTAKNHGVFLIAEDMGCSTGFSINTVDTFFQKPSMDEMKNAQGCTFVKDGKDMAWIDTGVIIFLPKSANALRELMCNELSLYTKKGLKDQIDEMKGGCPHEYEGNIAKSIVQAKLELYSHLLLAIPTKGTKEKDSEEGRLQKYLDNKATADFGAKELQVIFKSLSLFELQACTVSEGSFIHLGTTREMLDYFVKSAVDSTESKQKPVFPLSKRMNAFLNRVKTGSNVVIVNSIVDSTRSCLGSSSIGTGSLLEYCHLENTTLKTGANCVVSGLRGHWGNVIDIPSGMVLQMLPLYPFGDSQNEYVFMYLGIDDEIKKHGMCMGVPFSQFLSDLDLSFDDLWDPDDTKHYMWNAKIHPVLTVEEDGKLDWQSFEWICRYKILGREAFSEATVQASLWKWKKLKRLSLSTIQGAADPSSEFSYRWSMKLYQLEEKLQQTTASIKDVILNRQHEELFFDYINESLFRRGHRTKSSKEFEVTATMFRNAILSSVRLSSFDIASRAFMLFSSLCVEMSNIMVPRSGSSNVENEAEATILPHLQSLKSMSERMYEDCKFIVHGVVNMIKLSLGASDQKLMGICSQYLQEAASALTSKCIVSSIPDIKVEEHLLPPVGVWVLSSAPARVDLSGGWSDTPPISYEYGGAVACLAVNVNRHKPLSARCRRVGDSSGIRLTIENRNINTGDLIFSESVHIQKIKDLSDYQNPRAKCALLKCALLALKVITIASVTNKNDTNIGSIMGTLFGEPMGLEIVSTSMLPHGSGLGTSSILAGCVLSCLGQCVGIEDVQDKQYLIRTVLNLEQILSTGGGWQDQVGGLFGGLKLCRAERNILPVHVHVEEHHIPKESVDELNKRLILAFGGQPRLAKNILQNVLAQWARRSPLIMQTVEKLVSGAHKCIESIQHKDFKELGNLMSEYWTQKKIMAGGHSSGVEPAGVRKIFDKLLSGGILDGCTLTGAGGGGFLAMLLSDNSSVEDVIATIKQDPDIDETMIQWFDCEVSSEGLRTFKVPGVTEFQLEWHLPEIKDNNS